MEDGVLDGQRIDDRGSQEYVPRVRYRHDGSGVIKHEKRKALVERWVELVPGDAAKRGLVFEEVEPDKKNRRFETVVGGMRITARWGKGKNSLESIAVEEDDAADVGSELYLYGLNRKGKWWKQKYKSVGMFGRRANVQFEARSSVKDDETVERLEVIAGVVAGLAG